MNIIKTKNISNIFICIIPLLIPVFSFSNAIVSMLSLLIIHILILLTISLVNKFIINNKYYNFFVLSISVVIVSVLGVILSIIFPHFVTMIVNFIPYILASEILLNLLIKWDFKKISNNFSELVPVFVNISLILLVIGLLRELVGLATIFGVALPLGNFKGIIFFRQAAGGVTLLAVIIVIYTLFINQNKEEK